VIEASVVWARATAPGWWTTRPATIEKYGAATRIVPREELARRPRNWPQSSISSNAGRAVGYNGVTVWSPEGKLLGRIRLPEVCGNITFGGPKRNRLFVAASQSLYAVFTTTQGAGPG